MRGLCEQSSTSLDPRVSPSDRTVSRARKTAFQSKSSAVPWAALSSIKRTPATPSTLAIS